MATPVVPVAPELPPAPAGVPAWLTRAFTFLLAVIAPVLDYWDPGQKIPRGAAQAAVAIAFIVAGIVFGAIHLFHSDVHEYGCSIKAVDTFVSQEESEIKTVWPDLKSQWSQVQPLLALLPDVNTKIGDFQAGLSGIQERLDSGPASDKATIEAALKEILAGTPIGPLVFPVPAAPPAAPEVPAAPAA